MQTPSSPFFLFLIGDTLRKTHSRVMTIQMTHWPYLQSQAPQKHIQWNRVTSQTCSCVKGQTGRKKKSFPACLSEKENRKIEFEVIRVSSLPVYRSHQYEDSSPLATAAYWSGTDCHLTSPQYVNSVMSRLHIHSHFVTFNTYKFNYLVRGCERTKKHYMPFWCFNLSCNSDHSVMSGLYASSCKLKCDFQTELSKGWNWDDDCRDSNK